MTYRDLINEALKRLGEDPRAFDWKSLPPPCQCEKCEAERDDDAAFLRSCNIKADG